MSGLDEMMGNPVEELDRIMPTSSHTKLLVAAEPLMDFLKKNYHPHCVVMVDQTGAEVLEGVLVVSKESKQSAEG